MSMKRQSETNIVDFVEETNSDSELNTPFLFYKHHVYFCSAWSMLNIFLKRVSKMLMICYFQKLIFTWISFKQC